MKQRIYHIFKTWRLLLPLAVFTISVLTYCGGGGGGGGVSTPPPPPSGPVIGAFTKTVALASDTRQAYLFGTTPLVRFQELILAGEMDASGFINSISLRYNADVPAAVTCPNMTIKLGHTILSALTITYASNVEQGRGPMVTALSSAAVNIPAGSAGGYFTIPLNGTFNYNGVDNLVVEFVKNGACTADIFVTAGTSTYAALLFNASDSAATTGSLAASLANMKFSFAGGGDRLSFAAGASSSNSPFNNTTGLQKVQLLYKAADINGAGPITGMAFPVGVTTTSQTYTVTVKLGHSTLTDLTVAFADNFNSGAPVTVASAASFRVPAGIPVDGYIWLPFAAGTFTYNGTDNLVVEVDVSTATGATNWRTHTGAGVIYVAGGTGSTHGGFLGDISYDIQFRFHGGTLDVNTPNGMSGGGGITFPFYNTSGKIQYLYRAAELGTKGAISKLACRVAWDSSAESGFNYTVVMGHTTAAILDTAFAANLASPMTVFSGTLSIPAVLRGDWIEIPLSTPFSYNGRDNLVVQFAGTGGVAGGTACVLDGTSATLYASREVSAPSSTATTGGYNNRLIDMRFTLQ